MWCYARPATYHHRQTYTEFIDFGIIHDINNIFASHSVYIQNYIVKIKLVNVLKGVRFRRVMDR